jgi:hypothetical protein
MYTLSEIAERWNKTENDVLRMAAERSLSLIIFYNGRVLGDSDVFTDGAGTSNLLSCANVERHRTNPDTTPLTASVLNSGWFSGELLVSKETAIELLTKERVFCSEFEPYISNDVEPQHLKRIFIANHRGQSASMPITRLAILVTRENAEIAESKYPQLVAGGADDLQSKRRTSERETTQTTIKSGAGPLVVSLPPREPEKPLRTMKFIADYCGVHESTVKDWRKNYKDFPSSPPGSGTVTALPSELNAWMIKKGKK